VSVATVAEMRGQPTPRRRAGDAAEEAVARHLAAAGWMIVARNVRVGRSELDIVALEPDPSPTLVFVEVRSASGTRFGAPVESVDSRKVERLYRAAWTLVRDGRLPDGHVLPGIAWRIDLVTVVRAEGTAWRLAGHLRGLVPP
jgi:putative endonuclease